MKKVLMLAGVCTLLPLIATQASAWGFDRHLVIRQVVVDNPEQPAKITIVGRNFSSWGGQPTIRIGEYVDPLVIVGDVTDEEIDVLLPDNLAPGDYRLVVSTGRYRGQSDEFDLTLGMAGRQGEVGPEGPRGEQGPAGESGPPGTNGVPGTSGAQGPQGSKGDQGVPGQNGDPGPAGEPGNLALAGMMCPPGESLRGFDASGNLSCATTGDDAPTDPPSPAVAPTPGDLFITELLIDSSGTPDSAGEWIEILNVSNNTLQLEGLQLKDDGSNSYNVVGSLVVEPGAYVVLGAPNPWIDHPYSGYVLSNTEDEVELVFNGVTIDRFVYDASFSGSFSPGKAMGLAPGILDPGSRQDPANWCPSQTALPTGPDFGTPHASNDVCQ
jgi:hypothetical protein